MLFRSCSAVEYGGSIDIMGNVDVATPLSTYHQWRMGLLDKSEVKQSWKDESLEINAVDVYGKPRAIFLRDGSATYWIEYRKAAGNYKSGLVIYRTDPPPNSSIQSPNPADSTGSATMEIGTDIWMLNLDNFSYASSRSSGSMTLQNGTSVSLQSGNISISASPSNTDSSIIVNISRKNSEMVLKKPVLTPTNNWRAPDVSVLDYSYTSVVSDIADFEAKINGVTRSLESSPITDWQPTYLNPFLPPQILQVKDLPEMIGRDADTGVLDADLHHVARRGGTGQPERAALRHRLARVDGQVEARLPQHRRVAALAVAEGEILPGRDVLGAEAGMQHVAHEILGRQAAEFEVEGDLVEIGRAHV